MEINAYQTRAELLLRSYMLSDSFIVYSSVIGGIFACKMVYDLSQIFTSIYFKGYAGLSKSRQVEWNNRSISTVHAIFITAMSLYLAFWSDLFSDDQLSGLVTMRSSTLSIVVLGVSLGYFLSDLAMIFWYYPSLGGLEYVVHHLLSMVAVTYAILTGEGQLYVYMVLVSEATTPGINLRWYQWNYQKPTCFFTNYLSPHSIFLTNLLCLQRYLDAAGLKKSKAYLLNGFMMVFAWLVARILLFIYLFYHVYLHYDQVKQMHSFGILLISAVPSTIGVMNLLWFWKIVKGLMKTLAKRH